MQTMIFGSCVVAVSGIYIHAAATMRVLLIGDPIGPRTYPIMIGGIVLIAGIWLIADGLLHRAPGGGRGFAAVTSARARAVAGVMAWTLAFYAALEPIGFLPACILYVFGLATFFEPRLWRTNICVAVIFAGAIFGIFTRFLGISLSAGPWALS